MHLKAAGDLGAQGLHCDAIIDVGSAFDIQLFWFPHDVAPGAGGTRFVPGSHLRRVNMDDVARYQHLAGEEFFAGPAGTVVIFHHGLWHAGAPNNSTTQRVMGKVRLNPTVRQLRLWDTSDVDARMRADDHMFARTDATSVAARLRGSEPWYEPSVHRLETVQRALLWRYLTGDTGFDVDWYLSRTERRAALEQARASPDNRCWCSGWPARHSTATHSDGRSTTAPRALARNRRTILPTPTGSTHSVTAGGCYRCRPSYRHPPDMNARRHSSSTSSSTSG